MNLAIEPSEYQEDEASTYTMDSTNKNQINGYTGTKDYLVIPRVVNGYNVKSVIEPGNYEDDVSSYTDISGGIVPVTSILDWNVDSSTFALLPKGFSIDGDDTSYFNNNSGTLYYSRFNIPEGLATLIIHDGITVAEGALNIGSGNKQEAMMYPECQYTGTWNSENSPSDLSELGNDYSLGYDEHDCYYDSVNNISKLTKIIFASGYSEIDYGNIFGWYGAKADVIIPYGTTSITNYNEARWTSINIPSTVTSIKQSSVSLRGILKNLYISSEFVAKKLKTDLSFDRELKTGGKIYVASFITEVNAWLLNTANFTPQTDVEIINGASYKVYVKV